MEYKEDGLLVITVMTEGGAGDLEIWAQTYGLTYMIAEDVAGVHGAFDNPPIPAQQLIGRGMEVLLRNTRVSEEQIEDALQR